MKQLCCLKILVTVRELWILNLLKNKLCFYREYILPAIKKLKGAAKKVTPYFIFFRNTYCAWPGPSYFVSGSKYFPSRIVLDVTGDVTD